MFAHWDPTPTGHIPDAFNVYSEHTTYVYCINYRYESEQNLLNDFQGTIATPNVF